MNEVLNRIPNIKHTGSGMFFLMAGPCVVEDADMLKTVAETACRITERLRIPYIFKASYRKANRSRLDSFSGIGDEKALKLLADIRRLNRRLVPKGLCLLPIRFLEGQALLYLYRPAELRRDLRDARVSELLRQAGYADESCALRGAAHPPLPRERRVPARGGAVPQLPARGREGLHRPPRKRF